MKHKRNQTLADQEALQILCRNILEALDGAGIDTYRDAKACGIGVSQYYAMTHHGQAPNFSALTLINISRETQTPIAKLFEGIET